MNQTVSIKPAINTPTVHDAYATAKRLLNRLIAILRIIDTAWKESRVEYKKHAILGGGWE
jgi:hypothetical protein